jgi:hypothetical protein
MNNLIASMQKAVEDGKAAATIGNCLSPPYFAASLLVFSDIERQTGYGDFKVDVSGLSGAILYCDENGSYTARGSHSPEALHRSWEKAIDMATLRMQMFTDNEWATVDDCIADGVHE